MHFSSPGVDESLVAPMQRTFMAANWKRAMKMARADAERLIRDNPDHGGTIAWIGSPSPN